MTKILLLIYMMASMSSLFAAEHINHDHHNHKEHIYAPIGIMGDHPHNKEEWMLSYRYGSMHMEGNKNGKDNVSTDAVLTDFMVAPLEMTMNMHMFSTMYGINDKLTFMAMLPYKELSMDHKNRMGVNFTTKSKGIGDLKLSGLYSLHQHNNLQILLNTGLSIPTGSIKERDDTPIASNQKLPYPMQLGSGTYDFLPTLTYTNHKGLWSWGAQLGATLHLGQNNQGYSLGDVYNLTLWDSYKITKSLDGSIRLDGKIWEDIDGMDTELNAGMVPTARTDLRSGKRVDLLFGANFSVPNNKSQTIISLEFGMPIYQKLDGPQLQTDYLFTIGSQLVF